jgi:ribosome-binding factor A
MAQGSRPDRIGEEVLQELSTLLLREVRDPGIGFVTLTRAKVSPDLQLVRVYYTQLGDEKARKDTARALERATPFLRRHIGSRVRLRRVPELRFEFDESVEHQDRIERILLELQTEREQRAAAAAGEPVGDEGPGPAEGAGPNAQGPAESPRPNAQGPADGPEPKAQGPREELPGPERDRS